MEWTSFNVDPDAIPDTVYPRFQTVLRKASTSTVA
jgi:hypothetical protein